MHDIRALAAVFAFLLLCGTASASEPSPAAAARGVTQRLLGQRSASVRFELIHDGDSTDVFEYSAKNGVVLVRGSSAVAMTRGLYEYLRARCNCMVAWSGQQLSLPNRFPDCSKTPGSTPYKFRQYFNVCTFGYTTVWWDWKRWEREIDWMALHGINMPLAMNGQEAVWSRVWQSMGLRRDDLREFFTGPAFLPWQRMGNVNRHGGPLSDAWMGRQAELQKLILRRERELGMEPIVPAFSGFVPAAFRALHPEAQITENSAWGNFPKGYQTFVLHPSSPFFQDIGARFIREYDKTFGASHYYLADTFNELAVPVSRNHRYEELAAFGKAVYSSIRAGNPDAVWVMQGWLFGNDQGFWDSPSVAALLKDVPDDRMMILDLCNESFHGWKQHQAFFG